MCAHPPIGVRGLPKSSIDQAMLGGPAETRLSPCRSKGRRTEEKQLPKFLIEREVPGAGKLDAAALTALSQKSCGVISELGPAIQWVQSYVTDDAITCLYVAPNEELIREHARRGGFPANRIRRVQSLIDPTTAEA